MLTPEVRDFASRSVLCWLATVDAGGQPNVSPKEVFAIFDDRHVVIANIASPTSVRNIAHHPRVCVSFVDVFAQRGFKLIGAARNIGAADPGFAGWAAPLIAMAGPRFPVHGAIVVAVDAVEAILAPSYRLYPAETTENAQVQAAMHSYGVQPAGDRGSGKT